MTDKRSNPLKTLTETHAEVQTLHTSLSSSTYCSEHLRLKSSVATIFNNLPNYNSHCLNNGTKWWSAQQTTS